MSLTTKEKQEIINKFQTREGDTGSPQVQIALLSHRIKELSEHLLSHKNDKHSRRGLIGLVGKRSKLFRYLETKEGKAAVDKIKKTLKLK